VQSGQIFQQAKNSRFLNLTCPAMDLLTILGLLQTDAATTLKSNGLLVVDSFHIVPVTRGVVHTRQN